MGPKPADERADHDLFRSELLNLINQRHGLVRLAALIDWQAFEAEWSPEFVSTTGRPALPTRLMAALLYLKHVYALSDEDVCEGWRENPYWQHSSGERYFQHELPCDPSSLVRWRKRIGEAGCEWLLAHSIEAARKGGVIKRQSLEHVVLDTTVQPKAIAHPTDSPLLNRAREQLVEAAQDAGIDLRQSYARVGKAAEHQAGRYPHAKQYRRMQREIRKLRTWLGQVIRDVQRKITGSAAMTAPTQPQLANTLTTSEGSFCSQAKAVVATSDASQIKPTVATTDSPKTLTFSFMKLHPFQISYGAPPSAALSGAALAAAAGRQSAGRAPVRAIASKGDARSDWLTRQGAEASERCSCPPPGRSPRALTTRRDAP